MGQRILFTALLSVSLVAVTLSFLLRCWSCGGLFTWCVHLWGHVAMTVAFFLLLAALCILVALIMQITLFCAPYLESDRRYNVARFLILAVGVVAFLIGVILYTARINPQWSYLFSVSAAVIATQVLITQLVEFYLGYKDTIY